MCKHAHTCLIVQSERKCIQVYKHSYAYTYVHTCTYTRAYVYMCTPTHSFAREYWNTRVCAFHKTVGTHTCMLMCTCTQIHMYNHACVGSRTRICNWVHECTRTNVCALTRTHVCIHTLKVYAYMRKCIPINNRTYMYKPADMQLHKHAFGHMYMRYDICARVHVGIHASVSLSKHKCIVACLTARVHTCSCMRTHNYTHP